MLCSQEWATTHGVSMNAGGGKLNAPYRYEDEPRNILQVRGGSTVHGVSL